MEVQHDIALREFNTLALNARAGTLYRVASETELDALVAQLGDSARELRVLGQGSNTVFTRDIDEPLLQLLLSDIVVSELDTPGDTAGDADRTDAGVLIDVGAGLPWQALVDWSCERQLAGLENLNRIPGSVGAAPVQNIGAYGVELGQRLVSVRGFDLQDRCWRELSNDACELGYRD
ncbi:MAG: FAD-binding protein, partial [Spongiibacteraceae bacterium]|nr:FAD-binding protein [Spongiibacteraceae bacterium]